MTRSGAITTASRLLASAPRNTVTKGAQRSSASTSTTTSGKKARAPHEMEHLLDCTTTLGVEISGRSKAPENNQRNQKRWNRRPQRFSHVIVGTRRLPRTPGWRCQIMAETCHSTKAPENRVPAGIAGSSPILSAIPMSPLPMVPATVQELPIDSAMTAQIKHAVM